MIKALIISNICLILILKGVPTWLWAILSMGYVVSNVVALILWEETTDKIKRLGNMMKRWKENDMARYIDADALLKKKYTGE